MFVCMCSEVLSAEEGIHGEFWGDFFRAIRHNSPPGDQQAEECGSTVCSPSLHRLSALECKRGHTHTQSQSHTQKAIKSIPGWTPFHVLFREQVLECIKMSEETTTSSSRIFVKILFQELCAYMGLPKLNQRLKDMYEHTHTNKLLDILLKFSVLFKDTCKSVMLPCHMNVKLKLQQSFD